MITIALFKTSRKIVNYNYYKNQIINYSIFPDPVKLGRFPQLPKTTKFQGII